MCKWLKEYDEAAKNIRDKGLSSDQYKIRIMDLKMYMIIFTVILVPASFLGFFMYKNVWWVGLVPLTIVAVLDTMAYRGIKSLKKDYELALFREKQKEEKESENNK
ncbi:MAG: hypothetical protein ACLTKZ_00740 [Lachnospiraceae bacterium]|jgi:hypothetical protein|nr:hypothetical protein [Bacillota bacterium]